MATTLTLEQMKQFVRDHFEDFVNKRNAAVIRKNMTSDFHDHDGPGGKPTGVDGDEQMMLNMYKAMPDLQLTIEEMIAEGDKVVTRLTSFGKHEGDLPNAPATGNEMEMTSITIHRIADGKLVEKWSEKDMIRMLHQIGVMKPRGG